MLRKVIKEQLTATFWRLESVDLDEEKKGLKLGLGDELIGKSSDD